MATKYTADELSECLDYEVRMLNASYGLILRIQPLLDAAGASQEDKDHALWAMMEDFCLHARLLIEFLTKNKHANSAKSHSEGSYVVPEEPKFSDGKTYLRKLNNQVAHLMEGRTSVSAEKLHGIDRDEIFRWIAVHLHRFKDCLSESDLRFRLVDLSLIPSQNAD